MKTQDIKNMGLAYLQVLDEALKGKQHKLDMDKDGDIDAKDFAHMRAKKKKGMDEEDVIINPKMKDKKKAGAENGEMAAEAKVNELKKSTLGSYAKKASADAASRASDAMDKAKSGDHEGFGKQFTKSRSRLKNAQKAIDKLAKESVNEGSYERAAYGKGDAYDRSEAHEEAARDHEMAAKRFEKKQNYRKAEAHQDAAKLHQKAAASYDKIHMRRSVKSGPFTSLPTTKSRAAHAASIAAGPHNESTEWPVYARIKENRAAHTKSATEPEAMDSKASKGEKDFKAMHKVDMQPAELEDKGHDDASKAGRVTKKAPARNGDNPSGDKIQTPVDTTKG